MNVRVVLLGALASPGRLLAHCERHNGKTYYYACTYYGDGREHSVQANGNGVGLHAQESTD